MITGDNTLTGSNISYKCNISDKNKKMLIVDFIDKKFVEEDFHYIKEENEEGLDNAKTENKFINEIEIATI